MHKINRVAPLSGEAKLQNRKGLETKDLLLSTVLKFLENDSLMIRVQSRSALGDRCELLQKDRSNRTKIKY